MNGSECAVLSEWIICVSLRDHMMGTMGGVEYEFEILHQQMAKKEFKITPPTSFAFLKLLALFS